MKRLDELGVLPAPWACNANSAGVYDNDGGYVAICDLHLFGRRRDLADARLIAAAPDLYEALREAVIRESCNNCAGCNRDEDDWCGIVSKVSHVQRWRKALEKAGGEE